jgi:hypothetical protein
MFAYLTPSISKSKNGTQRCLSFNRKVSKQMMVFKHTAVIKLDSNRDPFTKHKLYNYNKKKELVEKTIISTIKYMLKKGTDLYYLERRPCKRYKIHNSQEHQNQGSEEKINSLILN